MLTPASRSRAFARSRRKTRRGRKLVRLLVAFLILYWIASIFVVRGGRLETDALAPAFESGDAVVIIPALTGRTVLGGITVPGVRDYQRGEAVVYRQPETVRPGPAMRVLDGFVRFVTIDLVSPIRLSGAAWHQSDGLARVVAFPGETVRWTPGRLVVEGEDGEEKMVVQDSALQPPPARVPNRGMVTVSEKERRVELGAGDYFLLVDALERGTDSRHYGAIPRSRLIGPVFHREFTFRGER